MHVMLNLSGLWNDLLGRRPRAAKAPGEPVQPDLHAQVSAAHREWQTAQQYFQSVSDPALVDHAVHSIIAAEQKYMYLLRKLRGEQEHHHTQGE